MKRQIAIAIPAKNEGRRIRFCLDRLAALTDDPRVACTTILVLANNCTDDTAGQVMAFAAGRRDTHLDCIELPPAHAHAGEARRRAFEAAAQFLSDPWDVLLGTDADTHVDSLWLTRTLDHLDRGYDAVAGLARLKASEVRALAPAHRLRLHLLRRYQAVLDTLAAETLAGREPGPRHFYEGGASMAITLGRYRTIGGAPSPPVGEDKALFEAVRGSGGTVRHPMDVKVFTSARLDGRASGGAADTLSAWCRQAPDAPIFGVQPLNAALGHASAPEPLTFETLPAELVRARELLRLRRGLDDVAQAG